MQDSTMKSAVHNYIRQVIRDFVCPVCNISIKAPEKWIIEHHMMHVEKQRLSDKVKDETQQIRNDFHPYF